MDSKGDEGPVGMVPEFRGCDGVLNEVFGNGLIFRKLEKMMSYSDLKICRLVCRRFNETIVNETDFSARTLFKVKEKTCRDKVLENVGFTLKSVQINPFLGMDLPDSPTNSLVEENATFEEPMLTKDDVEHVYEPLKVVECIRLKFDSREWFEEEQYPSVNRIIEGAAGLKKLALNRFFANSGGEEDPLGKWWGNLVDLEITSHQRSFESRLPDTLMKPGKLQRITIHDGHHRHAWYHGLERSVDVEALLSLVAQNQSTLEYLNLYPPHLWAIPASPEHPAVTKTIFPKLQEVNMRIGDESLAGVSSFLQVHLKQLSGLTVRVLGEFPVSLLGLIQEHAGKLQKLSIESNAFDVPTPGKLAFIADLKNLKEFKLQFIDSNSNKPNGDSLDTVLSYVPASVRKLSLVKLPNPRNEILSVAKIQMLSKLSSLTLVDLRLTFKSLQAIFTNMTCLRELEIVEAQNCTDKAFTGRSPTRKVDNAVSISNLKLLKSLVLRDCGISDRTVEQGIKFAELTKLDISDNDLMTSASVKIALANNPSLEILTTDWFHDFDADDIKSLQEIYPRFKKCRVPEGGNYDADDSDEDAVYDDSDFSGGSIGLDDDYDYFDSDNDYYNGFDPYGFGGYYPDGDYWP